jgi:predicted transcriptional regulator
MKTIDYTKEEQIISEAIIGARKVQEFLWQDSSLLNCSLELEKEYGGNLLKIRDIRS